MVSDDALEQLIEMHKSQSDDWGIAQDTALALAELQAHRARLAQSQQVVDLEGLRAAVETAELALRSTAVTHPFAAGPSVTRAIDALRTLLASLERGAGGR